MPGGFCVNMRGALPACSAALRSSFCALSTQIRLRTTKIFSNERSTKSNSTIERLGVAFFVKPSNTMQRIENNLLMQTNIETNYKLM